MFFLYQVILFKFGKKDGVGDVAGLEIPIIYEVSTVLFTYKRYLTELNWIFLTGW